MRIIKRLNILILGMISFGLQAQNYIPPETPETPLTEVQVRRFMKTELAVNRLQKQIMARAGEFNQLERGEVKVFYEKRKPLVESYGWDLDDFEEVRKRVFAARSAITEYEDFKKDQPGNREQVAENNLDEQEAESQKAYQEMIDQIKENDYLSEAQKKTMIDQIEEMQERTKGMGAQVSKAKKEYRQTRYEDITRNRADWPAVRPYLDTLQHLTDWYSGNRSDPPVFE